MNNLKCINPEIGQTLAVFELGQLEPEDQKQFEAHLSQCEFCLNEILEMMPFYMELQGHQEEVREVLREEGLTFEELKKKVLSSSNKETFASKVATWLDDLISTGLLVFEPFKITAQELVPIATPGYVLTKSGTSQPPSFKADTEHAEFKASLELYNSGEYGLAGDKLQKIAENRPDYYEPWFYLGICRFMEKRAPAAIEALTTAKRLAEDEFILEIRWYLAQSYILNGNISEAKELLVWLQNQQEEKYPELARKLLSGLQDQSPTP